MMQVVDAERRFSALFRDTYGAVRRYARHRGLSGADADDLVADVFTVAWRKLDRVPDADPIPWLFAVARNHWRNHLRRNERERTLRERVSIDLDVSEPEPSDLSVEHLRRALDVLADNDREILKLVAWDGLEPHRAAVALGITARAARVRLHRARTRFAAALETLTAAETQPERHESRRATRGSAAAGEIKEVSDDTRY
jgi:RNA polymerase sigma-70 factor (ECF subfamily)